MLTATETAFSKAQNKHAIEKCVICWLEFEPDDRITELSCSHLFHTPCSTQLNKCPLCIKSIRGRENTSASMPISYSRLSRIFTFLETAVGIPDQNEIQWAVDSVIDNLIRDIIYEVETSSYPEFYDIKEHQEDTFKHFKSLNLNCAQRMFAEQLLERLFHDPRIMSLAKKTDEDFARNNLQLIKELSCIKKFLFFKGISSNQHKKIERGLKTLGGEGFYSKIYYKKIKFLSRCTDIIIIISLASLVHFIIIPLLIKE